ncbi:unnamed protein product [Darwinula stevensoni]|uniref:Angiotensin-converting enzyme n=1 Tax=Darwinula stevensoni TaxID=69355 RepID=A0A7R9A598_9CRUS|nr:unnamed protein product [Darwinula stevensoni]CAG0893955.1 unnamed protein product [Darwinula stevensoni]
MEGGRRMNGGWTRIAFNRFETSAGIATKRESLRGIEHVQSTRYDGIRLRRHTRPGTGAVPSVDRDPTNLRKERSQSHVHSSTTQDCWPTLKRKRGRAVDVGPIRAVPKAEELDEVTEQSMVEALRRLNGQDIHWQLKEADNLSLSYAVVLGKQEADFLFASLESSTQYYSGELTQIRVYGKWHPIPRKQVAYGDTGLTYRFSGITVPAKPWTPLLKALCDAVSHIACTEFNFVLINRYKDGNDRIGEHRDDEKDLDPAAPIASVSLGQPRDFVLRHQDSRKRQKARSIPHEPESANLLVSDREILNPFVSRMPPELEPVSQDPKPWKMLMGVTGITGAPDPRATEQEAQLFMDLLDGEYSIECNKQMVARWDYITDATEEHLEAMEEANVAYAEFKKSAWQNVTSSEFDNWETFSEPLRRRFQKLRVAGTSALPSEELLQFEGLLGEMENIYATAKICPFEESGNPDCTPTLPLEPALEEIMALSTNYDELAYVWEAWREVSGAKIRNQYVEYVSLLDQAAEINGFEDASAMWVAPYDSSSASEFQESIGSLWEEVRPLYLQLHAYVRNKLSELYPGQIGPTDPIPAHLLGNMWAQQWGNIASRMLPFPDAPDVDVTEEMLEQGYDAQRIFELSEEFFTSLGLLEMTETFWSQSMIEKPDDGRFHEALGDTLALSVGTPKHLQAVGLLGPDYEESYEADINFLFGTAMDKVAFLPFGYLIDLYRWKLFKGEITSENMNAGWWELRTGIQGLSPPVERTEEHFDPGAKYHVPANVPYVRYFVSFIVQFQFYEALCRAADEFDPDDPEKPLYKCDYYGNHDVGALLTEALSMGYSEPWAEAMELLTGQREMSAQSLLYYFQPLMEYLEQANLEAGNCLGWGDECLSTRKEIRQSFEEEAEEYLLYYEGEYSRRGNSNALAAWAYQTDITQENLENYVENSLELGAWLKAEWETNITSFPWEDLPEGSPSRRKFKFLSVLGAAAASAETYEELQRVQGEMETIYGTARVCPMAEPDCDLEESGLTLEPDLELILATSTDPEELLYVWDQWRAASGAKVRTLFQDYIRLSNEAAVANDPDGSLGIHDMGDIWLRNYDSETFKDDIAVLWENVKPLYEAVHAYTRAKLFEAYGPEHVDPEGPIPAHLLGNMWAQQWENIFPMVKPFDLEDTDITDELVEQGYDARRIFEVADEFFRDLGLMVVSDSFWENSMLTKPDDREVVCHASAWDFLDGQDFRIKMCTGVDMTDFITVHHEMGHIQYFLQYANLPVLFRDGANNGFHEAVGDTLSLSVSTPGHLYSLGLLSPEAANMSAEAQINFLLRRALEKVSFLPFGYVMDLYRWNIFNGSISDTDLNAAWWALREEYQGLQAGNERTEEMFDAGAKYHTIANVPYIRYFVAHILQFTFHKTLCIKAGQYDPDDPETNPLHLCDIAGSSEAGLAFEEMLRKGSSEPWPDVLEELTGERTISADAILEYFAPLTDFLESFLKERNIPIGWKIPTNGNTIGKKAPFEEKGNVLKPRNTLANSE